MGDERDERGIQSDEHMGNLERMVDRYGDRIYRMCFLYLGERQLAEDAVQDTFLKAFLHYDAFRKDSSEQTWLIRIAINICKNYLRAPWFRHVDYSANLESINTSYDNHIEDDTVICEIMKLPGKYKEVILLFYYQQMSIREVAESLEIPEGTVSTRLRRGKERLKHVLKGWYFDE